MLPEPRGRAGGPRPHPTTTGPACNCLHNEAGSNGRQRKALLRWRQQSARSVLATGGPMRVLLVHPSPLLYSELYLRLEPLGLERVAAAARAAGHEVRLLDLQVFEQADYLRELDTFRPRAVGFSLNYLANVPEVIDLARATRARWPEVFV